MAWELQSSGIFRAIERPFRIMSTVSHLPHRLNRTSDGKSNDVTATYALDSMAQGDGPDGALSGHTRNDQMDMHRMGKDQELRVSADVRVRRISCSCAVANISSDFDVQFRHLDSGDVGGHSQVSYRNARETTKC